MNYIKRIFQYPEKSGEAITPGVRAEIVGESKTDLSIYRILNTPITLNQPIESLQNAPEEFEESDLLFSGNDIDLATEAVSLESFDDSIALSDFQLLESETQINRLFGNERIRAKEAIKSLQGSELLDNFLKKKNEASSLISDMLNEIDDSSSPQDVQLADMSEFLTTN